jgi:hypothetical protein
MYLIFAACLAMTKAITGLRRHMPHATPVCHIYGDMNCVTSPQTGHMLLLAQCDTDQVTSPRRAGTKAA